MNTTLHRFAIVVLLLSGLLGAIPPSVDAASAGIEVQHRDFMLGLLGATLMLSVFVPWLRLPAIGASVLSKLAFIAVAAATAFGGGPVPSQVWLEVLLTASLVGAGIVFLREAWQEARWNGMLPVRLES
jgi:hypothetical protein